MRIDVLIQSAWQALFHNQRRSFLTIIGIVIGVASIITTLTLSHGYQTYTLDKLTDGKGGVQLEYNFALKDSNKTHEGVTSYTQADIKMVNKIPGVKSSYIKDNSVTASASQVTINKKKFDFYYGLQVKAPVKILAGRNLQLSDDQNFSRVTIISDKVAEKFHLDPEKIIGKGIDLGTNVYTIVGIFKEVPKPVGSNEAALNGYLPKKTYSKFQLTNDAVMPSLKVTVETKATPSQVSKQVLQALKANGSGKQYGRYETLNNEQLIDGVGKSLSSMTYFVAGIAAISLIIAGVGVMNMMYTVISERSKEIGIRRVFGATDRVIQLQFLFEGMFLTLIGGILGYILGFIVAFVISRVMPFSVVPDLKTILTAIGISSAVGLIFSYLPAKSAAQKNLVDVLR
ncbi:MAG: ABC transporter permease [Streptococcaceae bacterium]|jgi:putative ABC transport system permease protein|nr:ABC transporter permease [Streptococcaceae bacterium]